MNEATPVRSEYDVDEQALRDIEHDQAHKYDPERNEPGVVRLPVFPESTDLVSCGWTQWDSAVAAERVRPCQLLDGLPCGILEVEFKNGAVYRYYHVTEHVSLHMQGRYGIARSVGKYFNESIRRNADVIPYRRMPDHWGEVRE